MHRCVWFIAASLGLPLLAAASPGDLSVTRTSPDHALQGSLGALRGFVSSSLAEAMRRHARRVELRSGGRRRFDQQRFVERFARRLLREGGRVDGRVLPQSLPLLPWTGDAGVQQVIDQSKRFTRTAKELYLHLERQTALLRGSASPDQQALAVRLNAYLAGYKDGWAAPWIASRLRAFSPSAVPLGLTFKPAVSPAQRGALEQRLDASRQVLGQALHPALLRRVSGVPISVDPSYRVAGIVFNGDGTRSVTLRPESSVKDVLHEYGHFIGYRGGLRALATAHALLSRRARGSAPEPLSGLIPNTSYAPDQRGYRGGFAEPYVGRFYSDGYTEVLSMGLEHLESPQRAAELFRRDGEHFLLLLKVLQNPPR